MEVADRVEIERRIVFILDEFDRVRDEKTKELMSDLIKYMSNNDDRTTVVIVGVAKNISNLFEEHGSLPRAVQQLLMPRMNNGELRETVTSRLPGVGMNIDNKTLESIVSLDVQSRNVV